MGWIFAHSTWAEPGPWQDSQLTSISNQVVLKVWVSGS